MTTFYKFKEAANQNTHDYARILEQVEKMGFSGDIKIYDLGLDSEDSISLIVEGVYDGEQCCHAVGYGINRAELAPRKIWYRQGYGKHMTK